MNALIALDKQLFSLINGAHLPFLDFIMYWASNKFIWIPFYVYLLYELYALFGKKMLYVLLMTVALIALSDQTTWQLKEATHRLRPCHNPELSSTIHLVNGECGGNFGFVSAHAANSMALAVFMWMILPATSHKRLKWFLVFYTLLLSYSRIYLGVHYPADVTGGIVIGFTYGLLLGTITRKKIIAPVISNP